MEALSLAVGIVLMLVAAIGIGFYVALVIAIPVWRMLDWLSEEEMDEETDDQVIRHVRVGRATSATTRWGGELVRRTIAHRRLPSKRGPG